MDYKLVKKFIGVIKQLENNQIPVMFEKGKATITDNHNFISIEHKDITTKDVFYVQAIDVINAFNSVPKKENVKISKDGFICNSNTYEFKICDCENYPVINHLDDCINIGSFDMSVLKEAVHFTADDSVGRYAITNVCIDVVERKVVASDGKALYIKDFTNEILPNIDDKVKILLSKNVIKISNKLFDTAKLSISKNNTHGFIKNNTFTYIFDLENVDFANWKQVIPNKKFMKTFDIELYIDGTDKSCAYKFENNLVTNLTTNEQTAIKYDGIEVNISYLMLQKLMKVNQTDLKISIVDNNFHDVCMLTTCDNVNVIFMPLRKK
jgi:hypothetical protein